MRARIADRGGQLGAGLHAGRELLKSPKTIRALTLAVLALGGILRLNRYLYNRSLFLDEAYIASNVLNRNLVQLTESLDYNQVAPLGWMALVRLATDFFGISEPALRLVPLLSGLGSLALFYLLAKRYLAPTGALVACVLLATTDPAIQWSVMVKQYSTDLLFAVAILLLTTRADWRALSPTSTATLASLGAISIWFSFPAVFVLVGVGAYGLMSSGLLRRQALQARMAVIGVVWFISFTALYFLSLRTTMENEFLQDYWGQRFIQLPTANVREIAAQSDVLYDVFRDPVGVPPEGGSLVVFLVGVAGCLMVAPNEGILLLVPVVSAYFASAAEIYPFSGRLLLFAVPSFHILIAAGVEQIARGVRRLGWLPVAAMISVLLFTPMRLGISRGLNPRPLEEMRPVTAHVLSEYRPGDAIYIYYGAEPAWKYYLKLFGAMEVPYDAGTRERENPGRYREEILRYRGQARLWLVFSHVYSSGLGNEESLILDAAQCLGTELEVNEHYGAQSYLYDMTRPSMECGGS
jgi:hypothetical protein